MSARSVVEHALAVYYQDSADKPKEIARRLVDDVISEDRADANGKGTREGELTRAQRAARAELLKWTGHERPMWRQLVTGLDTVDDANGIGPVCHDEGHEAQDSNTYDCCPEPLIEVDSPVIGAYLVELLNRDAVDDGAVSS